MDRADVLARVLFADPAQASRLEWGVAPLPFSSSTAVHGLLADEMVDDWLDSSALRYPLFTLAMPGVPLDPAQYTRPRTINREVVEGFPDPKRVRSLLGRGASLFLHDLQQWHPGVRQLCCELSRELRASVGAAVFATPAGHGALATHRDDAHVFAVQISGAKRWHLYDVPAGTTSWRTGLARDATGPAQVIDLHPGEALYVPPGQAHKAIAGDEASLHLSVTVREPRLRALLDAVMAAVTEDLPDHSSLSGDASERAAAAQAFLRRIAQRVEDLDPAALVARLEDRLVDER